MAKITYLIGAGASANTIPVVAHMHQRMIELNAELEIIYKKTFNFLTKKLELDEKIIANSHVLKHIVGELNWLISEAGNYYTIDTLAKKYYLTNELENLKRLKKCLITYFTLEQYFFIKSNTSKEYEFSKAKMDRRYGTFIAAITRKRYPIAGGNPNGLAADNLEFELSPNINVLSWNYDMQFEIGLKLYTETTMKHVKEEFQIIPNKKSLNSEDQFELRPNRFAFVKLNGDAIWELSHQGIGEFTIFDGKDMLENDEKLLGDYLEKYGKSNFYVSRGVECDAYFSPLLCFNFAWENDSNFRSKYSGHSRNLKIAETIALDTEILVVIGYSFPVFNREIDNVLISSMENLRKVYIQDVNPDRIMSTMVNAFERLQQNEIVNKLTGAKPIPGRPIQRKEDYTLEPKVKIQFETSLNQFVIPYELIS